MIIHFAAKDQFLDMASMVILRAFKRETIRSKVDYEQFEELQDIDYTGDRTGKMQIDLLFKILTYKKASYDIPVDILPNCVGYIIDMLSYLTMIIFLIFQVLKEELLAHMSFLILVWTMH